MSKERKIYIAFQEKEVASDRTTKIWHCYNIQSDLFLGKISWAGNFRAYAFEPNCSNNIFDINCLGEIVNFLMSANREHRINNSKEGKLLKQLMKS